MEVTGYPSVSGPSHLSSSSSKLTRDIRCTVRSIRALQVFKTLPQRWGNRMIWIQKSILLCLPQMSMQCETFLLFFELVVVVFLLLLSFLSMYVCII